jgi:hypothetical protein
VLRLVTLLAVLVFGASAHAADAALVAEWPFDEGGGTLVHDSGGSGLTGTLDPAPDWIPGVTGSALRFDNDAVRLPESALLRPAVVTVAAWVRHDGSPGPYRYVLSSGSSSCFRSSYGLYTDDGGGAAFYVAGDGAYTVSPALAPGAIWDGRWHRLAASYDGSTVRLYLDGAQVGNGTPGPTHIEYLKTQGAYIGTYLGSCALPFIGDIDAPAIWNGALGAAQLAADATVPADAHPSGPVGPAPGRPPVGASPGARITPQSCTSVRVSRRTVRVGRRTTIAVTVRLGTKRRDHARVTLNGRRLHRALRTDRRGRGAFRVRATRHQRRLMVRVRGSRPAACGTPKAFVRVLRSARAWRGSAHARV